MFEIKLLPPAERGPDGERLGEITIGAFSERFGCHAFEGCSLEELVVKWRQNLQKLLNGAEVAVLQHDPRFAWVVYCEGQRCYVQQVLSPKATFEVVLPRETESDGCEISEWELPLEDIASFLKP